MHTDAELAIITLDTAGTTLTFDDFTMKGIPGFATYMIDENTEAQFFSFQVSTLDCKTNEVVIGMEFTMSDGIYVYTFKVRKAPVQDLVGYNELAVDYISKVAV